MIFNYFVDPDKVEMITVRQNPVFLWNKRHYAKSQVSELSLKTQVTCASAPLYCTACFTMWQGTKPMRQQLTQSVTQISVIAISSFPSTIDCNLRRHTTTSSSNTSRQILCSLHKWPWQLTVIPTILTRIPHGWMASSRKKGMDATAGMGGRMGGASSPQVRAPQPRGPQQEEWAQAQQ